MPLSRIKSKMEVSQLRLDSSAASTDVNEGVLLDGTDSADTNDGYAVILEDATANAFDGGVFRFSEVPILDTVPTFHVGLRANSGVISSATYTKVGFDKVIIDTHGWFDNASNYRYTPLIAGYYHISVSIRQEGANNTYIQPTVYKNGLLAGGNAVSESNNLQYTTPYTQSVIHLNGSTDYVEGWGYTSHSSGTGIWGYVNNTTRMDGYLISRTA